MEDINIKFERKNNDNIKIKIKNERPQCHFTTLTSNCGKHIPVNILLIKYKQNQTKLKRSKLFYES